jgi:hypothetical protein
MYASISAVWIRAGSYSDYGTVWDEYLAMNANATNALSENIIGDSDNAGAISKHEP